MIQAPSYAESDSYRLRDHYIAAKGYIIQVLNTKIFSCIQVMLSHARRLSHTVRAITDTDRSLGSRKVFPRQPRDLQGIETFEPSRMRYLDR